jgi:hypothetical protein
MRTRVGVLHTVLCAACLTGACAESPAEGDGGPGIDDPEAVVARWNEARNHGEVEAALALLADDASVLGFRLDEPGQRAELGEILAAQAAAGFELHDRDCQVAATIVTCEYEMVDEVMLRWDLALHGVHRYEVADGRITAAARTHDQSSEDEVYRELDEFRRWVADRHPDLVHVIWSTPGAAAYTTVLGAQTMISLLDDYETSTGGATP